MREVEQEAGGRRQARNGKDEGYRLEDHMCETGTSCRKLVQVCGVMRG